MLASPASTPKGFPPLDDFISVLSSIDYKLLATRVILIAATIAAVITGVSAFAYRNARKFWVANGDDIVLGFLLFVEWLEGAIEKMYQFGVVCRPVANRWVAKIADWGFYFACELSD
jgi:hypothetical protein